MIYLDLYNDYVIYCHIVMKWDIYIYILIIYVLFIL